MSKANFTTALEAEAAFYQALAQGNVDALMAVWSEEEEVVCVHPGGPRIVGLAAVRETWRQILSNGNALKIDVSQAVVSASAMMAMHCVFEHVGAEGQMQRGPTLAATNVLSITENSGCFNARSAFFNSALCAWTNNGSLAAICWRLKAKSLPSSV